MGHSLFQGLEPQRFISKMIALILALALVAPSMSAPQFLRFANPTSVLGRTYATTRNAAPAVSTPDLTALYANFEASKPLVEQAEALSNGVFPNDGPYCRRKPNQDSIWQCSFAIWKRFGSQCSCRVG